MSVADDDDLDLFIPVTKEEHKSGQLHHDISDLLKATKESAFAVPLYFGFKRILKEMWCKNKCEFVSEVRYTWKNGAELKNLDEVHQVLLKHKMDIPISVFTFEAAIRPLISALDENDFWNEMTQLEDLSEGTERIPIPVVCLEKHRETARPLAKYVTEYRLADNVNVNLKHDDGFLVCCECVDDCKDKLKCACFLKTLDNCSQKTRDQYGDENIGYNFKLLERAYLSGIFECNRMCKCKSTCFNRVAQNGIFVRLQLFMTRLKGWGVRTLCDIPKGSYICNYVGNVVGGRYADKVLDDWNSGRWKYLGWLNVGEPEKEGYEAEVVTPEEPSPPKLSPRPCSPPSPFNSNRAEGKEEEAEMPVLMDKTCNQPRSVDDEVSTMSLEGEEEVDEDYSGDADEQQQQSVPSPKAFTFNEDHRGLEVSTSTSRSLLSSPSPSPVVATEDISEFQAPDTPTGGRDPPPNYNRHLRSRELEEQEVPQPDFPLNRGIFSRELVYSMPECLTLCKFTQKTKLMSQCAISKGKRTPRWTRYVFEEDMSHFDDDPILIPDSRPRHIDDEPRSNWTTQIMWGIAEKTASEIKANLSPRATQLPRRPIRRAKRVTPRQQQPSVSSSVASTSASSFQEGKAASCVLKKAKKYTMWTPSRKRNCGKRASKSKASNKKTESPLLKFLLNVDGYEVGNIARYFNHSCNPNVFPQYVYIECHDLRLPYISFFAKRNIRAGEELCWNYNYESGNEGSKEQEDQNTDDASTTKKRRRKKRPRIPCLCGQDNCTNKLC